MSQYHQKNGAIIIEGHVQGLSNTRSLGEKGIPVIVIDKVNCIARYSKYCAKYFLCPDFIKDEFADFLIDLAIKENIRGWMLLPSNDHAVYTISKHKKELEEYYKVITPSLGIIEYIYDKVKLINLAAQHFIPIPTTQSFKKIDEKISGELQFPVITKGRNGLSFYKKIKAKALMANNETELRKQLNYISKKYFLEDSFTQELIPDNGNNKTISFTAFCIEGEIMAHWTGVKIREHPIQFGTATFAKSTYVEKCHNQSARLLEALNYTGVCEIEYLKDPRTDEYKLIEMNPRTWLWVGLAKYCGVDYAIMTYNYLNNINNDYPSNYLKDVYWINPITDTIYAFMGILKKQLKLRNYINSVLYEKKYNALIANKDFKPFVFYLFSIFSFLKNR